MPGPNGLGNGIVHVSFPGGGMFLPIRTPYDRQTLVEHVKDRARAKGQVQVLVNEHRWIVRFSDESAQAVCCTCGHSSHGTCCSRTTDSAVYCIACALGDPAMPRAASAA